MSCQETSFERADCRIDVSPEPGAIDGRYMATMFVIEPESRVLHPLVFRDGSRVMVSGVNEAAALNSALTYLESRFGGYSETMFGCPPPTRHAPVGDPIVIEE
jgi:hypothetical protein